MYCLQACFTFTKSLLLPMSNFWRHVSPYSWFLASNLTWKLRASSLFQCIPRLLSTAEISRHLMASAQSCFLFCLSGPHSMWWHAWSCCRESLAQLHGRSAPRKTLHRHRGSSFPYSLPKRAEILDLSSHSVLHTDSFITFFVCSCLTRL